MNYDLEQILVNSNLQCLISKLFEEGIHDVDTFKLLKTSSDSDLVCLAPKIGDRLKLKRAIESCYVSDESCSVSTADTVILEHPNMFSENIMELSDTSIDLQCSTPKNESIVSDSSFEKTNNSVLSQDIGKNEPSQKKRRICVDKFDKVSIMKWLEDCGRGKALIDAYKGTPHLTSKNQDTVCQIVMDHLIKDESCSLTSEGFSKIADIIVSIFHQESKQVYFLERLSGKRKVVAGKVYNRYVNNKCTIRKITKPNNTSSIVEEATRISEEENEIILWLKHNTQPWETVITKWTETSHLRVKTENFQSDMADMIVKWPLLKNAMGYSLIEIDYSKLYPDHDSLKYMSNWDKIVGKLLDLLCSDGGSKLKDVDEFQTDDLRDIAILSALPRCLGSGVRRHKGKTWKPSLEECQDGFIKHVHEVSEIGEYIDKRRASLQPLGLSVQPSIFAVHHHDDVLSYYVQLEDIKYKFNTIIKALGVCFYIFQVFNLEYPYEAKNAWTFLQRCLFKLPLKLDKLSPQVCNFENLLNQNTE